MIMGSRKSNPTIPRHPVPCGERQRVRGKHELPWVLKRPSAADESRGGEKIEQPVRKQGICDVGKRSSPGEKVLEKFFVRWGDTSALFRKDSVSSPSHSWFPYSNEQSLLNTELNLNNLQVKKRSPVASLNWLIWNMGEKGFNCPQ